MSNEEKISDVFKFTNGRERISVYYDAWPDRVQVDPVAWLKNDRGETFNRKLDRVLVNMGMSIYLLEEMIAEECGF